MKQKIMSHKRLLFIILVCMLILVTTLIIIRFNRPVDPTKEYLIKTSNYFEYQSVLECSGYASAYALRSLGYEIAGLEIYNGIPTKYDNGLVDARDLVKYLTSEGYSVALRSGELDILKAEIRKGIPVVVVVHTAPGITMTHYIAVVGYDEENILAADSLKSYGNSDSKYYNRKISNSDFLSMWDIGIYGGNFYITFKDTFKDTKDTK